MELSVGKATEIAQRTINRKTKKTEKTQLLQAKSISFHASRYFLMFQNLSIRSECYRYASKNINH